jgi:hypothetical protein
MSIFEFFAVLTVVLALAVVVLFLIMLTLFGDEDADNDPFG